MEEQAIVAKEQFRLAMEEQAIAAKRAMEERAIAEKERDDWVKSLERELVRQKELTAYHQSLNLTGPPMPTDALPQVAVRKALRTQDRRRLRHRFQVLRQEDASTTPWQEMTNSHTQVSTRARNGEIGSSNKW